MGFLFILTAPSDGGAINSSIMLCINSSVLAQMEGDSPFSKLSTECWDSTCK